MMTQEERELRLIRYCYANRNSPHPGIAWAQKYRYTIKRAIGRVRAMRSAILIDPPRDGMMTP